MPDLPKLRTSIRERDEAFKKVTKEGAKMCYPYAQKATKTKKLLDFLESGFLFNSEGFISS